MKTIVKRHFSFIPIPALVVIVSALYLIVKPSLFYEPPWLLPITNTVFVTVVFFIVAYIALRNYKATGRIQVLLLGCGVLAFGIGGIVAGLVRSIPGAGANLNVTIHNTGALMGAVFHFAAALILLVGISPEVGSERKEFWLVFSYVGLIVFMALFTVASLGGIISPFFIQGVGPTALRQWVLGTADILFALSFLIFMGLYLRNGEVFLYWYSSALALIAIGLTAIFIQRAVGSPIGWAGRFSQYLGGIYFLVAIIKTFRSARVRRTSFDEVLTASLSPAEEKFRALAEHSPDMIERFDREMKHIYVNQAGVRLHGKPISSIIGKTIEEARLPGADATLLKERTQRVFETAQPMEVEHYISTENGTRFYQSHCVPEFGVDGTIVNVLVVTHDLTERKQAEEALRKAHEELEKRVRERTSELSGAVERLRVENVQRKLLEDSLRESEKQVRFFAAQCLTAQENERKRIAGELHDSIVATLGALRFAIDKMAEEMKQGHANPEVLQGLGSMVSEINNDVRRIMADLRPAVLDDLGIIAALNWLCREYQKTYSHISVETQIGVSEHEVPDFLKTPIFRISQEALNNIAKHSKATVVNLSLQRRSGIELVIRDNGQGFDLDTPKRGLGLSTMRERAQLSGGTFSMESVKEEGTTIRCWWPLA